VAGSAGDDILVLALSLDGEVVWHRRFGGDGNDNPAAVARGPAGEILLTGSHEGVLDLDGHVHDAGGDFDVFVAALAPDDGALLWRRSFEGSHDQVSRGIAADDEAIYLVGQFRGEVDLGAGLHVSAGLEDAFVVALSPDGRSSLWSQSLGDAAEDIAFAVTIADGPVVAGRFEGTLPTDQLLTATGGAGFVAAFDRAGAIRMSRVMVEAQDGGAYDLALAPDGRLVVAGYYDGLGDDQGFPLFDGGVRVPTIVVQKITLEGGSVWARTMTVHQNQTSQGNPRAYRRIAIAADGAIALGGFLRGTFADTEPAGDADAFAALLEP
jgi:outer membrane protein assembly factor BamB